MNEQIEFTIDEINLAGVCFRENRAEMLCQLKRIMPELNKSSLGAVGVGLMVKLLRMSDEEYAECGLVELYAR